MNQPQNNPAKKVIVIGAGPAGLAAAHELVKLGASVEVFEASKHIGGMARSFELFGQRVDCGPHRFFSKDKIVNQFFRETVKDQFTLVNRLTRIYYNGSFFNYPLKIFNVLRNLSPVQVVAILYSFGYQKLFPMKSPKSFEDWVTDRFGKKLFNIFFKTYSEKLWGIPCSKIDADWAAQRIKTLTLFQAVINALVGDKDQKHKTLVDQFAYPNGGTGAIYENAARYVNQNGGQVQLEKPIRKVIVENGEAKGVVLASGETKLADAVISTMPLTLMVKGLDNVPADVLSACGSLYFRNTILVYFEVNHTRLFPDNWIYIHSSEVRHGRLTNFRNWCPSLYRDKNTSILCMEFWAFEQDEIWKDSDENISRLGIEELHKIKLVPAHAEVLNTFVLKIPKCYPVYETGYREKMDVISKYLDSIENLYPIGRYGAFKYNNQDHSILMGVLAARKIVSNAAVNLWEINTDTEYQEEGKIKDVLIQ